MAKVKLVSWSARTEQETIKDFKIPGGMMRGKWSGLYIWPLIFLLSKGRVMRKCRDCGARACPVMTFGDEKQLHVGYCCK